MRKALLPLIFLIVFHTKVTRSRNF